MSHLGPWVSAYVDGQMPVAEAERAHAHLAVCPRCQAQVLAEGTGRQAARQARPVRAGEEFTQRLLALDAAVDQEDAQPRASRGRYGALKVVTGALASLGIVAVALFVLGGPQPEVDPQALVPDDDMTGVSDRTGNSGSAEPLSGNVLTWLRSAGWAAPHRLPAGMRVQGVRSPASDGDTMQLALTGEGGAVSVVEQHGTLSSATIGDMASETIGGREAYRLDGYTWVVQCADSVVAISSAQDPGAARALVADMPADDPPTMLTRMSHGLQVLLGRR